MAATATKAFRYSLEDRRRILLAHVVYLGLSVILLSPLVGLIGSSLLSLSGNHALTDLDILFFVLTPVGAASFLLLAALFLFIAAFEQATLMTIAGSARIGQDVSVIGAFRYTAAKATRVFRFALLLVVRIVLLSLPFLAVAGAVAFFLLTEYDINFYLAERPREFWIALILVGAVLAGLVVVLVYKLLDWSMTLPLVLFADATPALCFGESARIVRNNKMSILTAFAGWALIAVVLSITTAFLIRALGGLLLPVAGDAVQALVFVLGAILLITIAASFVITAITSGSFAFVVVDFFARLGPFAADARPFSIPRPSGDLKASKLSPGKLAGLLAAGVVVTGLAGIWLLNDIQINEDTVVIAHRGASGSAPENTLAAIRQAIEDAADWIEIDVQETADGEIVVAHDADFMRHARVNLTVGNSTLEQIREIDIGSWFGPEFADERVPTLAEVLDEVKGRSRLIIELKYYGHEQALEQRVIDLVESAGLADDVMVMSLHFPGVRKVQELRPDWTTGLLAAQAIGNIVRLDADFLAVSRGIATPALVRASGDNDKELYVWTVNDAVDMTRMLSLGVDGLITDEPRLARQVVDERNAMSTAEKLLLHSALLLGKPIPEPRETEDYDPNMDSLERQLETSRHEKLLQSIAASGTELAVFTTDGCSGGLSIGWQQLADEYPEFADRHGALPPWQECCVVHDQYYHRGGSGADTASASFDQRRTADLELEACVVETGIRRSAALQELYDLSDNQIRLVYESIAAMMYRAVRLGGIPCTELPWRWGYGWPLCSDASPE